MGKRITVDKNAVYVNGNLIRNRPDYDAVDDLYSGIQEYMASGKIAGGSHLSHILQKALESSEKYILKNSNEALRTITQFQKLAEQSNSYFSSKKEADKDYTSYLLDKGLMPWQRDVLKDLANRIILIAGRRAGKSFEVASHMVNHCLDGYDEFNGVKKPRQAVYIGLTIEKAASVIWDILKATIDKCHIPVKKIDAGSYTITFSNGASIKLWGNNSKADREKLRGLDASMFVIDECQSQQGLLYLVNSIIGPIVKGRKGVIVLAGTGPLSGGTYWEEAIVSGCWSVHKATMMDNITIPDHEHALEEVLRDNNWTEDNITFRREYLAEIVHDTNRMVYPFRKYYEDKPVKIVKCIIGLDFGFKDATAIIPLLIDDHGQCWVYAETKERQMKATDIVTAVKAKMTFIQSEFSIGLDRIQVVCDTNEPSIAADIYNQGLTNICNAYKVDKDYTMRLLRDALEAGDILIKKGSSVDEECENTVWKWNAEKEECIYEIDDSVYHPDSMDALRYAFTQYLIDEHLISQA